MRRGASVRPHVVGLLMVLGVVVAAAVAFHPRVPFVHGHRIALVVADANGLRGGSPVRIAGVDVGEVVGLERGPGHTTAVTVELEDTGLPVHRDATARIRPRVFLEGGFFVELRPGSPSSPELEDGGVIPLAQTSGPVQLHQALTVFDQPTRDGLRTVLHETARGLDGGGAAGFKALVPQLGPVLRDLAWGGRALRGTEPRDVSRLVTATRRLTAALDDDALGGTVDGLAATAAAVRDRDGDLRATLREAGGLLRATPEALRDVDAALPRLEGASRAVGRALPDAPEQLRATATTVGRLGRLVRPARRATTVGALETALRDLPDLIGALAGAFPATQPLAACLSSHLVPLLQAEVPDGSLSTGRPVWQDFAHALVGLASASSNFDGNGHYLRYQVAVGDGTLSTTSALPAGGPLLALAPSTLRSRPLPRADRQPPPVRTDEPCSAQPRPDLRAAVGSAGLREVRP